MTWFSDDISIAKYSLLALLLVISIGFTIVWSYYLLRIRNERLMPSPFEFLTGFVTDFLDTLGVGSFATTSAMLRFGEKIDDKKLPGTLNVGHTLPTILQAFIYIQVIEVDTTTLWLMIVASALGSYLGASFVVQLPKQKVQLAMGAALIAVGLFIVIRLSGVVDEKQSAVGLTGLALIVGIVANFVFGALMTIGIGAYAPIMITVCLLGMNAKAAFPIMMGSCALLMPVASVRFIRAGDYVPSAALGLTLLGLPGVLIAAFIVKELNTYMVNWLVVIVVLYTAFSMIYSGLQKTPVAENK